MAKSITAKKFITLSCEAIEGLSKNDARRTYKAIKSKNNKLWQDFSAAQDALSRKVALNEALEELPARDDTLPARDDTVDRRLRRLRQKEDSTAPYPTSPANVRRTPKRAPFAADTKRDKKIRSAAATARRIRSGTCVICPLITWTLVYTLNRVLSTTCCRPMDNLRAEEASDSTWNGEWPAGGAAATDIYRMDWPG